MKIDTLTGGGIDPNSTALIGATSVVIAVRWRTQKTIQYLPWGAYNKISTFRPKSHVYQTHTINEDWGAGGSSIISRSYCIYQNGFWYHTHSFFNEPKGYCDNYGCYYAHRTAEQYIIESMTPEIDWTTTLAQLDLTGLDIIAAEFVTAPPDYDSVKSKYAQGLLDAAKINAIAKTPSPDEPYLEILNHNTKQTATVDEETNVPTGGVGTEVSIPTKISDELRIPTPSIAGNLKSGSTLPEIAFPNELFYNETNGIVYYYDSARGEWTDPATVGLNSHIEGDLAILTPDPNYISEKLSSIPQNTCIALEPHTYISMWLRVYLIDTPIGGGLPSGSVEIESEELNIDRSSTGSSGFTSFGSAKQGMNNFSSSYGSSVLPFNSVYLTGENYNSFVSAGGGIITQSGIFPFSENLYVEKIRLSVEGSSATITELVDFDAAPSIQTSEKIFCYIFNESNTSKPVFTGYITSRKRTLNGNTQQITYECNDLSYFFDQLYSPSHYIYRPPSYDGIGEVKSYDRVLKENLNVAGITDALISLPTVTAPPINWVYEPLRSVLEWTTNYFGKYVYYIDRYGRLNLRASDSLSNVKTYTIGDKSGDISVMGFEPIQDFSRTRSRIVLTGDYELKEEPFTSYFAPQGQLNPNDNDNQTGIFWFNENIDGQNVTFYYFMYKPGKTLNNNLLSDPSKSASIFNLADTTQGGQEDLPIKVFKTDPGDSEIYVESEKVKHGARLEITYCTRSDSPIQVSSDLGGFGGTEVIRRPEFKKASAPNINIDDTALMQKYLNTIKDFYKTIYGGVLTLDGLDTDIYLLAKVSIDNSSLPSRESDNLICYAIEYDMVNQTTTVDLSNKVFADLPFFDAMRERKREDNELIAKIGLIEESQLYKRLK